MFTTVDCKTVLKGEFFFKWTNFKYNQWYFASYAVFSWHLNILPTVKPVFFIYFLTSSNYTGFEKDKNYWNKLLHCGCALPVGNVMRKNSEQQFCDWIRWFSDVPSILGFHPRSVQKIGTCGEGRREGKGREGRIILLLSNVALLPNWSLWIYSFVSIPYVKAWFLLCRIKQLLFYF